MTDRNAFRQYLGQGRKEGAEDEDAALFRRSRRPSSDDADDRESVDYDTGSRLRAADGDISEDEQVIDVKKKGKDLLLHNMVSAALSGAARQVDKFFRRLIQR